jgi:hypothetical protein
MMSGIDADAEANMPEEIKDALVPFYFQVHLHEPSQSPRSAALTLRPELSLKHKCAESIC